MNNPICCNNGYFTGTADATITQGSAFDPRAGVNAYDENDNPIPFVAIPTQIDTSSEGTQYIAYIANGVDPVVRTVTIEAAVNYRTVLYPDGTLIINEDSNDQAANEQAHGGVATNVYPALDANNPYVFTAYEQRPWHGQIANITAVEAGSPIAPTSCGYWFGNCSNLISADMTNIDTSNCTAMNRMFSSCSRLTTINTEDMDVSACTNMDMMFFGNASMTVFNLCGWDTSNVTNMGQMFRNNTSLTKINADEGFVVTQVTQSNNMFAGDTNLVGGQGTAFDSSVVNKTYAKVDGGASDKGYFTNCASEVIYTFSGECNGDPCYLWGAEDPVETFNRIYNSDSIKVISSGNGCTHETEITIEDYDDSKTYTGTYAYKYQNAEEKVVVISDSADCGEPADISVGLSHYYTRTDDHAVSYYSYCNIFEQITVCEP